MNVPLSVNSEIQNNEQCLKIIANSQKYIVRSPFAPYVYSSKDAEVRLARNSEEVEKILFSTRAKAKIMKHEFATVNDVSALNAWLKAKGKENIKKIWENHLTFTHRVSVDLPEFFIQYPHTDELKPLCFDIETLTKDNQDMGTIIAIGVGMPDDTKIFQGNEEDIIKEFIDYVTRSNANILVGYGIQNFDIKRMFERAKQYTLTKKLSDSIRDLTIYDMYEGVRGDQSLYGIKNHQLKTVAKWYGLSCIELDRWNTCKYTEKEIHDYNRSDIDITSKLYDIYIGRYVAQADVLKIPLNIILEGYSSTIPSIIIARGFHRKNIVSDLQGNDIYPEIAPTEKGSYQGAYVALKEKGLFKNITKADFKQFYPSIQVTFNLSPETTYFERLEPYDKDKFKIEVKGDRTYITIPDKNIGHNVVIWTDRKEEGVTTDMLIALGKLREKYKSMNPDELHSRAFIESQSTGIKVCRNIFYGYAANAHAKFGNPAVSIAISGIARELIQYISDVIDRQGATTLEVDTDGVYFIGDKNKLNLDYYINDWLSSKGISAGEVKIEYEDYIAGYFSKKKTYILLKSNGQLRIVGGALKGSHKCRIWDAALNEIGANLLKGEPTNKLVKEYLNPDNWNMDDLVQRVTMGKTLSSYASENCLVAKLAVQGQSVGLPVKPGFQFEYIKTTRGYLIKQLVSNRNWVDIEYYTSMLNTMFGNLGLLKTPEEIESEKNPTLFQACEKVELDKLKRLWE